MHAKVILAVAKNNKIFTQVVAGLQYFKMSLKNILNHDAHVKPSAQSIPYQGD
jgi:hypothetical protein